MTHDLIQQSYQAGVYARQAGRGRESGPRYGIHPEAELQRRSWAKGWDDEDREQIEQQRKRAG